MRLLLHGGPIFTGLEDTAQHGLAVLVEDGQIVVVDLAARLLADVSDVALTPRLQPRLKPK